MRNKINSGYSAYFGRKRIAWSLSSDEVIKVAIEFITRQPTKNRYVPPVIIFDQAAAKTTHIVIDDKVGVEVYSVNKLALYRTEEDQV